MSADDKEKEILKSLESEAAFYMKKPVNPEDLKIVWQYAVASKKGKKVVMEQEIGSGQEETSSNDKLHHISSSSENEESGPKKKKGRKRVRDQGQEERDAAPAPAAAAPAPAPPKKAKVIWTNTLHDLFLQAVSHIGLESKTALYIYIYIYSIFFPFKWINYILNLLTKLTIFICDGFLCGFN